MMAYVYEENDENGEANAMFFRNDNENIILLL